MDNRDAFNIIDKKRRDLGVGGRRLEQIAGLANGHYSKMETGVCEPRKPTLTQLKIALQRIERNADCDASERSRLVYLLLRAVIALCCELDGFSARDVLNQDMQKRATQDPKWLRASQIRQMALGLANSGLGITPAQLALAVGISRPGMHYLLQRHENMRDDPAFDALIDRLELAIGGEL